VNPQTRRFGQTIRPRPSAGFLSLTLVLGAVLAGISPAPARAATTYQNPLTPDVGGGAVAESCADPSVMYGAEGEGRWYMYCTTDPLHGADRDANGNFVFHLVPMFSSADLVTWTYEGDAFTTRPAWLAPNSPMWAPEIAYLGGQYLLYYAAPDTNPAITGGGSAIGVATAPTPVGPWTDSGDPVVDPAPPPTCCPDARRWTFDPDVISFEGTPYIYYGSYFGGLSVRQLAADGLESLPETQAEVAIPNRYEGPEVVAHDGYLYLFASATNCCNGDLTGYSVFAGRATSPTGPFTDREGVSLMAGRVGGTPVISMNGNRWVGPGHNTVFVDFSGQWWTIYHAVDRHDPYFAGAVGFTKRPALLDPLDWIDGWPTVRGGHWASDEPMPAPAAQPGTTTAYVPDAATADAPGDRIGSASDEFNSRVLHPRWSWVRPEAATTSFAGGGLRFATQAADLHGGSNNASVLRTPAPSGDYVVETRVRLDLPPEGCCFNFVQAGLVVYGSDDAYIKLVHVGIFETRQTEFAKERADAPPGYPFYGNTVVGPPADWTWLRIVKRTVGDEELYRAYTSRDGVTWVPGGVWTHSLSSDASIGLVSMGGAGFTATFDYVRTFELAAGS
jgi:arabinan endo-1,5-alpha-L-arabinosidase